MQIVGTPLFASNAIISAASRFHGRTSSFQFKLPSENQTSGQETGECLAVRSALSALPIPMLRQPSGDSLLISDLGKKLSLHEKRPSSLTEARKADAAELPEWAEKIDKSLQNVVSVIKKMKDLTELAQDKSLTDLDRIEIQIEIEDMRANLAAATANMRFEVKETLLKCLLPF